jgi:hypothetical protein
LADSLEQLVSKYVQRRADDHGWERVYLLLGMGRLPLSGTNPRPGVEDTYVERLVKFIRLIDKERGIGESNVGAMGGEGVTDKPIVPNEPKGKDIGRPDSKGKSGD